MTKTEKLNKLIEACKAYSTGNYTKEQLELIEKQRSSNDELSIDSMVATIMRHIKNETRTN